MTATMNKSALVTSIAIIMNMLGHEKQLEKMSTQALEAMYSGLLQNAEAFSLAQASEKEAKTKANIAEARVRVLEAEVKRIKLNTTKGKK